MVRLSFNAAKKHFVEAAGFNRQAIWLASITTVASLVLFALQQYSEEVTKFLEPSPSNPWGFFIQRGSK